MAEKLASYSLQAELGDFISTRHAKELIEDMNLIPPTVLQLQNIINIIDKVQKLWARLRGMSSDAAISQYLSSTMQLKEYGHKGFEAQDGRGHAIRIGACFIGIFIKHYNGRPPLYFRWPDIQRMKVKDKSFTLETYSEEILFAMADKHIAKYVLKELIAQHTFFCNEQKSTQTRQARSRSHDPEVHSASRAARHVPSQGTPLSKKGKYHSVQEPSPLTQASRRVAADLSSTHKDLDRHNDSPDPISRTEVEIQPKPSFSRPESPKKETPISKLVTVVRRESSRSGGHHTPKLPVATKEADFPDGPHEEVIVANTPKMSKYIPRNLRESSSIGIHSKPIVADWLPNNKSDSNIIGQDVKELQIEIKSSLSSPSVSTSPVSVVIKDTMDEAENEEVISTPHQQSSYRKSEEELKVEFPHKRYSDKEIEDMFISEPNTSASPDNIYPDDMYEEDVTITFTSDSDSDTHKDPDSITNAVVPSTGPLSNESSSPELNPTVYSATEDCEESMEKVHKLIELLEDKLQSGSLIREYSRIPKIKLGAKLTSATAARNIYRNRYRDILPYEENRVKLNPSFNLANNDYINASLVQFTAGNKQSTYVLAQGPLPHTCTDFWQMIWEQESGLIVMTTNLTEAGKIKCHQYFPNHAGNLLQFEQYRVTCTKCTELEFGTLRYIELRYIPTGEVRTLHHLQYAHWPDHGAPEDPKNFNELMRCIREYQTPGQTTVVHCSAGVGRSGVVVLMDWLVKQFRANEVCLARLQKCALEISLHTV
jgi:protein tyrosine phosphatase